VTRNVAVGIFGFAGRSFFGKRFSHVLEDVFDVTAPRTTGVTTPRAENGVAQTTPALTTMAKTRHNSSFRTNGNVNVVSAETMPIVERGLAHPELVCESISRENGLRFARNLNALPCGSRLTNMAWEILSLESAQ
jgi:hypothetical protein